MEEYFDRLIDKTLKEELEAFGAVLISGPKWCGKTTTAKQIAKSIIFLHDPERSNAYFEVSKINSRILLNGENPRLIDEWQLIPEIWDAIRFDIDEKNREGLYILTGSNIVDENRIKHSGAGRISRLLMRTMSLYETHDSNGEISLSSLFISSKNISSKSNLSIEDIANLVIKGGWPSGINKSMTIAMRQVAGYIDAIAQSEIKTIDGVERDPVKAKAILRSIARNIGTSTPDTTILADVVANIGSIHINTITDYLKVLRKLYVIEDLPAWTPLLRSKTAIRVSNTRYFTDPAIAAVMLNAKPKDLLFDIRTFGFLFESLVIRDLRIYAQNINGEVFQYHDKTGLEIDAIIHLNDGRWGAVEIKLGSKEIEKAAKNLIKLRDRINIEKMNEPAFLAVITGTEFAYQRKDDVYVIPIGCLKP